MRPLRALALALFLIPAAVMAAEMTTDRFEAQPENRWRFFADTVMGGVSNGQMAFLSEDNTAFARLTGTVSTANNGGFIQMRRDAIDVPATADGVRLVVRGNNQAYFIHLRTSGTVLPWQYYQAKFEVDPSWQEIRLPFSAFSPSGRLLRDTLKPASVKSIGIVAYGRDHEAAIDIREIGFYDD